MKYRSNDPFRCTVYVNSSSPCLTPSLPQPVKNFRAQRCTDAPANSLFSGPVTHLFSMLWVLMKILSHANVKKKTKMPKSFKFRNFIGCFQVTSGLSLSWYQVTVISVVQRMSVCSAYKCRSVHRGEQGQSDEHRNRFKGNAGDTSERQGGAHMSFCVRQPSGAKI